MATLYSAEVRVAHYRWVLGRLPHNLPDGDPDLRAWMERRWREELANAEAELAEAKAAARRAGLSAEDIDRVVAAAPRLP